MLYLVVLPPLLLTPDATAGLVGVALSGGGAYGCLTQVRRVRRRERELDVTIYRAVRNAPAHGGKRWPTWARPHRR